MNTTTQHTTQYKNSALGLIPEDWDIRTLGEVTDYIKGFAFSSSDYTTEGIRIIRISDTTSTSIKEEGAIYMNIDDAPKYKKWELQLNDLVFTTVGSRPPMYDSMVGKVIKIEDKYKGSFLNQNAVIIRAKENTNQEFIYSQFKVKRYLDFIETIVRGNANQVSITLDNLFKYQLLFPSSEEQKAIADCLSTWHKAIEKHNALIAQKELSKKALMQQLLSGKKRLKGFSAEWRKLHIKDVSKEVSQKNKEDRSLTVLFCTKYAGLVPSLEYFGRKIFADDLSTYKIVKRNHFAYATNHIEEGSLGYQERFDEALISPMYTVFKTNDSVNDVFFYKLLKSHYLISEYNARMEGSIDRRGGLRWDAFSIIKIKLPTVEEQTAIAKVLQCADAEIQLLQHKLTQLKEQKKGLMQVLLTGKKRLKY